MKIDVKGTITTNDSAWLYEWLEMDYVTPKSIREGLDAAAGEDVTLEINSYGGSCTAATEIRQAIKDYKGEVTANVLCAMSAATVIACAADRVLMADTGVFMIHNSQSYAEGDYRDMKQTHDALKQFNEGIINAYEEKTGLSREKIQSLMDKDTYMSPQRAIELGFVDGMIDDVGGYIADAAASIVPLIPANKITELAQLIKENYEGRASGENRDMTMRAQTETTANETPTTMQDIGEAGSEINITQKGAVDMTLTEFLAENPDAQAEVDAMVSEATDARLADARAEGARDERERIRSLDAISSTVTAEALNEAKYGEDPIDGKELAYQAMVKGEMKARAYMAEAINDSKESGVDDVEVGSIHAGEMENFEADADALAEYTNKKNGR